MDTIRFLTVDAVERAKSGHPGGVMGAADAAFVMWNDFLRHDPSRPDWIGRDRFVLSAGHMSMLVYSLLHLSGYGLTLDDLRTFRQWGSRTAGHPEHGLTPGVEVTAGPLGAGFAHAVGMALAARMAGARFADGDGPLVGSRILLLASDGDLMEGVSSEAASLAGHLGLGNLVCVWDDNRITIEGSTDLAFTEDVIARFAAQGFRTARVDGHDRAALRAALSAAVEDGTRPTFIASRTRIAYGSPGKEGSHESHGAPLGSKEAAATKRALGWPEDSDFLVPEDVRAAFAAGAGRGAAARAAWEERVARWKAANPSRAREWDSFWSREVPGYLLERVSSRVAGQGAAATRQHSMKAIQAVAAQVEGLVGGSADLAPSNSVGVEGGGDVSPSSFAGRNIHFGVREHAMGAMVNGMALFGGFRPYAATYLVFSDYLRPALRLAALMEIPAVYVFTHDSFHVGEDGPTHQPIEHLWAIRAIPRLVVFRPADAVETAAAWAWAASSRSRPTALVFTRQKVPAMQRPEGFDPRTVLRGGYLLEDRQGATISIVATGSEVAAAREAASLLEASGVRARVVSMPSVELFLEQDRAYRDEVLPRSLRVVTVEAGSTVGWHRFTGSDGLAIGIDHFGASAPAQVLEEKFGFGPAAIAERIRAFLSGTGGPAT